MMRSDVLLLWMSLFLYVSGEECPTEPGLKEIIKKYKKDVPLKSLDGEWMVVQAPETEFKEIIASYSSFDINEAWTELSISVYDYPKEGGMNMYFQTMKMDQKTKVISWTGNSDDGPIDKDTIVFYFDERVLGYYSCDPKLDLAKGSTVRIMVNAKNRKALLEDEATVKKSLNDAVAKLNEMKTKDDKWKKGHEKPGLFNSPIKQMDFKNLKPEK